MNVDSILKYIEYPDDMPSELMSDLKNILDEYPYFQTAHLLYIKHLNIHKSLRYADQLKVAAVYAGDRRILFDLIKNKNRKAESLNLEENVKKNPNTSFEADQVGPSQENDSKFVSTEEIIGGNKEQVTDDELNQKSEENKIIADESVEDYVVIEGNTSVEYVDIMSQSSKNFDSNDMLDFDFDFDDEDEGSNSEDNSQNEVVEKPKSNLQPQFMDYMSNIHPLPITPRTNVSERHRQQSQLIDKFLNTKLENKPRQIANDYEPEDISAKSVEGEFLSETLAKIYLKQKKYQEAMKIYQKLSLKYPQKNSYFAQQIIEIKNKLTNK